jgi:penicillin-binding protein 1A
MGFDQPRNLGNRETGGGLALPIWIGYMQKALKDVPVDEPRMPDGIIQAGGDYYYSEYPPGSGVPSLGVAGAVPGAVPGAGEAPKTRDEVKNELF